MPAFIIKRLPVRLTYDNNYFNDPYQGIPVGGYNVLTEKLLAGIEVRTGIGFNKVRNEYKGLAEKNIYTGLIDEFFDYQLGALEYRGLKFETCRLEEENHQGVAVMNYTDKETPYTRSIEHKHFAFGKQPVTYVTREYPADWKIGEEGKTDIGFIWDHTGDNISSKNASYCESTGSYWAWNYRCLAD